VSGGARPPRREARRAGVAGALALIALLAAAAHAQPGDPVAAFQGDESVATSDAAHGYLVNPAAGGIRYPGEFAFAFTDLEPGRNLYRGVLAMGGVGLAASRFEDVEQRYSLALRAGQARFRAGIAGAYRVDEREGGRTLDWKLGALSRPRPWLSVGATLDHLGQPRHAGVRQRREWALGAAWRPLAHARASAHTLGARLTLSADAVVREGDAASRADLVFGAAFEPVPGLAFVGSVEEHGKFRIGLSLLGPRSSVSAHAAVDGDGDRVGTTWAGSAHASEDRTVFAGPRDRRVATMRIGGDLADDELHGFSLLGSTGGTVVAPLHRALEHAQEDPLTRAVLLDLRHPSGAGQIEELRARILRLRAAGKPVVAYLETGANRGALELASACDRIVTTEEAMFVGLGLRAERRYYRDLLARWGVRFDRVSIGAYKSAYRGLSADSLPPADREVIDHNLDVAQEHFLAALEQGRGISRERFAHVLDGRAWEAEDLVAAGLVDTVASLEDARALAGRLAGLGAKPRTARASELAWSERAWFVPRRIAVVYASGAIETGRSGSSPLDGPYMGSETVVEQLERAFRHRDVEAVVLRVDSPGGSAIGSNLIHAATVRLKRETKKPLVVSMGDVAASGGYYIACAADHIVADRLTATGSIGVVFLKPSIEGWYAQRGVRQFTFERGDRMNGTSLHHDWDEADRASADSAIARSYATFLAKVAAGRGRPADALREVAQGRVWFGMDALEHGLVDALGGLDDAIAEARRRASVPPGERIAPLEIRRPRPRWLERAVGSMVREAWERNLVVPDPSGVRYEADVPIAD
jgi:protease-4